MTDAAIARIPRPRIRVLETHRVTLGPHIINTDALCYLMAWAAGYLTPDQPQLTHDLYQRQFELQHATLGPPFIPVPPWSAGWVRLLVRTLRDAAAAMPIDDELGRRNKRARAGRRLLLSAADTIAAQVTS
jgi:hypothetical protein